MQCFVCGGPADRIDSPADAISIRCPKCGEYDVSPLAQERLGQLTPYSRMQALRYAQTTAEPGRRPHLHALG
ncbi:hypothetical protein SAMN05428963_102273 [Consotaella salsifontis]|uniref:Uncharacterized protein n=1 Tax=Consotaella salsifontis TaxID=1365950 RepID=A0A1T4MSY1_9HYPH|nr:hypothetical protein SAMN05428963_102273 [Consotaella salsifontis]